MGKAHPAVASFPLNIPAPTMGSSSLLMTLALNKLQLSLAFKVFLAFWETNPPSLVPLDVHTTSGSFHGLPNTALLVEEKISKT